MDYQIIKGLTENAVFEKSVKRSGQDFFLDIPAGCYKSFG